MTEMAGPRIGAAYVEKLMAHCLKFDLASERGARRDDIRPGLRVIGSRRYVTIAFTVSDTQVVILRVFTAAWTGSPCSPDAGFPPPHKKGRPAGRPQSAS